MFATQTAQSRGLDAYIFHRTLQIIDYDKVAHLKWFVEADGKRSKQIAEYGLQGQRDGDTTYTQTGDEGRDVDAQIGQYRQQYGQQYGRSQQKYHRGGGRTITQIGLCIRIDQLFHPHIDAAINPYSDLNADDDNHGLRQTLFQFRRKDQRLYADQDRE